MTAKSERIAGLRKIKISEISRRDLAMIGVPALVIVVAAFWGAYQFVQPAPPTCTPSVPPLKRTLSAVV